MPKEPVPPPKNNSTAKLKKAIVLAVIRWRTADLNKITAGAVELDNLRKAADAFMFEPTSPPPPRKR